MVQLTKAAIVAILAATANADHHRFGRRHQHQQRGYVQAPPPSYPAVPDHSSSVYTVPEASSSASKPYTVPEVSTSASKPYPTAPEASESSSKGYPTAPEGSNSVSQPYHTGPAPSGPHATYPAHSAPYEQGNNTVPYVPTGTGASSSSETIVISTATVIPLPETTPVGASSGNGGNGGYPTGGETTPVAASSGKGGNGGNGGGYPTGGVPSAPAGGETCGPVTVTVTVTPTVTAGKPSSEAPEAPKPTTPVASESAEVPTYPVNTPEKPTESESKPAYTPKPETTPVATESSKAPATYPAVSETKPVYTPKPETTPVASQSSSPAEVSSTYKPKPSSGSTGGKRGVIYQEQSDLSALKEKADVFGWSWNWNGNDFGADAPWTYVPIINNMEQLNTFAEQAKVAISKVLGGTPYVMGLNEPDQVGGGGAGVSYDEAAQNYIDVVQPLGEAGAKLGSISVTSHISNGHEDTPKGLDYLEAWKKSCDSKGGCKVDFVCLHYYGNPSMSGDDQFEDFKSYLEEKAIPKVNELFGEGTPIWLSEVSAMPYINEDTDGKNVAFIKKLVPYLEAKPEVEKYAYYMASPGYLIDGSGALTPAGEAYCSA